MKYYRFCLYKTYFEQGYNITNYVKYLIILGGLQEGFSTNRLTFTFIVAFVYAISCFFIGWGWYKFRFIDAEIEVRNKVDPFVREMREKFK